VSVDLEYCPRRPEESPLYATVAGNLETYLARQRERDRCLPGFVEREFREFLDCGVLARGFLRLRCSACGLDRIVPYSCKNRGICNSCGGRRMADTAAHLIDRVFPRVPVRQWVLSFPHALRYRLAYDARLVTGVLDIFIKMVFASLIRRAREFGATRKAQCGAVTFIQRFDSALGLNLHLHMLALDGIYAADDDGAPQFQVLLAPDDEEIRQLAASLAERIPKLLERRGLGPETPPEDADPLSRDQPGLASLYAASVSGQIAFGPNAGRRVTRTGDQIDPDSLDALASPRCASVSGFSLHANTAVNGADRPRLERLIRYCARPAVAMERLDSLEDGRLRYRLKRPWRDGTTHVIFQPLELLEKLAALVPAPRAHLTRYSGVLAPAAKWRVLIVPASAGASAPTISPAIATPGCMTQLTASASVETESEASTAATTPHGRNYGWAELMKRVWELDVLECPRCRGRMRIVAAIHSLEASRKILDWLGLPSRAPPVAPPARQSNFQIEPF
jgi:hypothetical protein